MTGSACRCMPSGWNGAVLSLMAFVNKLWARVFLRLSHRRSPEDIRCLQRPGRRVYADGRSGSYAGIGYPMMTDASEGYLVLAADISASALVQYKFEDSLYRARRP